MKKLGSAFLLAGQTVVLTVVVLCCVIPFSCRISEEGVMFAGGDYVSPVLEEVSVLDERNVRIAFSEKVTVKGVVVSEQIKDISDSDEHSSGLELSPAIKAAAGGYGRIEASVSSSEDGRSIICSALESYEVGMPYEIFGTVQDKAGNTLTFCVPFCGYNSCMPKLVLTEVQPKYKKYKEDAFRCEFVELLALTDGNLSGIELVSGADGEGKKFAFPPVAVSSGEVFVIHLRSAGSGCITETDNLNASTAVHSAKNVRDIWVQNDKARLGDSNDIIAVRNSIDGTVFDMIMYASEDSLEWGKGMTALSEIAEESGIYENGSVSEAEVNSGLGSVAQKSFTRTDAADLQRRALAGEFSIEGVQYPLGRNSDTWIINAVSPGTL